MRIIAQHNQHLFNLKEKVAPASGRDLKSNAPPAKVYPPLLRASKLMDMTQYLARVQSYFDQLG